MSQYLEEQVKSWVGMDNDIRDMSDRVKVLKDDRSSVQTGITEYIADRGMVNTVIRTSDSDIRFNLSRTSAPLTFKHLQMCLADLVQNEEQVQRMIAYIKDKRPVKETMEMKRIFRDI